MNYISFKDLKYINYLYIFKLALILKKKKFNVNKNILFIFDLPSTRTKLSFELACKNLNCKVCFFEKQNSQISRGEKKKDTYKVFEGYFDLIIHRGKYSNLKYIKNYYKKNIINALNELEHPTQIINDIFTIFEIKKNFLFKILWVGEYNNVSRSLLYASKIFGFKLLFLTDKKSKLKLKNKTIKRIEDAKKIDVLMTDTWYSMNQKKIKKKLIKVKYKYFKKNKKTYFMHCLPLYRGKEVEKKVLNIKKNLVWKQSKNKLITSMALIKFIFK
ncbi:hypothetical protein ACWNYQ_00440 [Candidatus Vidania fulgoroideorum]